MLPYARSYSQTSSLLPLDRRPPKPVTARRSTASPNMVFNPSASQAVRGWTHLTKARWVPHLSATPPPGSRANFVVRGDPNRWACMAQVISLSRFSNSPGELRVQVSARFRAAPTRVGSSSPRFQLIAVLFDGTGDELASYASDERQSPHDRWLRVRHDFEAFASARFVLVVIAGEGGLPDQRILRGTRVACCSVRFLCDLTNGTDIKKLIPQAFTNLNESDVGPSRIIQAYRDRKSRCDIPEHVRKRLTNGLSKDAFGPPSVSTDIISRDVTSKDSFGRESMLIDGPMSTDATTRPDWSNVRPLKMSTSADEVVNFGNLSYNIPSTDNPSYPVQPPSTEVTFTEENDDEDDDGNDDDADGGAGAKSKNEVKTKLEHASRPSPVEVARSMSKAVVNMNPGSSVTDKSNGAPNVTPKETTESKLKTKKSKSNEKTKPDNKTISKQRESIRRRQGEHEDEPTANRRLKAAAFAAVARFRSFKPRRTESNAKLRTSNVDSVQEELSRTNFPRTVSTPRDFGRNDIEDSEYPRTDSGKMDLPQEDSAHTDSLGVDTIDDTPVSLSIDGPPARSSDADSLRVDGPPKRSSDADLSVVMNIPEGMSGEESNLRNWLGCLKRRLGPVNGMRLVSPNMIVNPSGKDGCGGWKHLTSDRWSTEVSAVPCGDSRVNFVATRPGCSMAQLVDLARFVRKPEAIGVQVMARYRSRPDAPAMFCMRAVLYDEEGTELAFRDTGRICAQRDRWELACLEFEPTPSARFALVFVSGADTDGVRFGTKVVECVLRAVHDVSRGDADGMLPPVDRPVVSDDCSMMFRRVMSVYKRRMSTEVYSRTDSSSFDEEEDEDLDDNSWTSSIHDPSRFFLGRYGGMRILSPNLVYNANAEHSLGGWTNLWNEKWSAEPAGLPFGSRCANFVSVSGRCAIAQPVDLRCFLSNPATAALTLTAHFSARNEAGAQGLVRVQAVVFDDSVRHVESFDSGEMDATRGRWSTMQLDLPPVGQARFVLIVLTARGGGGARVAECSLRATCNPLYGDADELLDADRIADMKESDVGPEAVIAAFRSLRPTDRDSDDADEDDETQVDEDEPKPDEIALEEAADGMEKSKLEVINERSAQDISMSVSDVSVNDEWHGPFSRRRCSSGNMLFNPCGAHGMRGWTHLSCVKETRWRPSCSGGKQTNFASVPGSQSAMGQAVDVEKFVRGAGGVSYSISVRFRRCPSDGIETGLASGALRLVTGLLDGAGEEISLFDSGPVAAIEGDGKWMTVKHVFAPRHGARFIVVMVEGMGGVLMGDCSVSAMYYSRHDGAQTVVEERFASLSEADVVPRGVVVRFARRHLADGAAGVPEWEEDGESSGENGTGNLLLNASGRDGVRGWVHVSEGSWMTNCGDGFTCSKRWCAMCQAADLWRAGQECASTCFVELRATVRAAGGTGGKFRLEGGVLDERFHELKRVCGSELEVRPGSEWQTARLVCEPVAGARFVVVVVSGQATEVNATGGGGDGVQVGEVAVRVFKRDPDEADGETALVTDVRRVDEEYGREMTGRAVRHFFGGGRRGIWRRARWIE